MVNHATDVDGWIVCRIRADINEVAVDCVLGLESQVEVVEPDELRERVVAAARAVLDSQQKPGAVGSGSLSRDVSDDPRP